MSHLCLSLFCEKEQKAYINLNKLWRKKLSFRYYKYMSQVSPGTVHTLPQDLQRALASEEAVLRLWEAITPLGRNEFICWVEDAKKPETRARRIERTREELLEGKRRPCCWMGCIHRPDKKISPSVQGILSKRNKKSS